MSRMINSVVVLSLVLLTSTVYAGPVGLVDPQKIKNELKLEGLIEKSLSKDAFKHNKVLSEQSSKVSNLRIELNKKMASLSSEDKKAMEEKIASGQQKLKELQTANQIRVRKLQQQAVNEIRRNVERVTAEVAAKHHIERVYTLQSVAYAKDKIDLTDEIIAGLRKIYGKNNHQGDD